MSEATRPQLTITRTFNAARAAVWKAWTDVEALAQWWGPAGATITVAKFDLHLGGVFHYSMTTPDGQTMWAKFTYGEIIEPEKLEFINSFSDADGGVTQNPWLPVWPREIKNVLTLEEQDGKTVLTLVGHPINATAEEVQAFADQAAGMQQGFAGTFAKLDTYLAEV